MIALRVAVGVRAARQGEWSAIAMAVNRRHVLAIDDRRARKEAERTDHSLRIVTTQDLIAQMISEGLIDFVEADSIKEHWSVRHRFHLKLKSFRDVCL